jgi:A/G-specific adenine glycosylase
MNIFVFKNYSNRYRSMDGYIGNELIKWYLHSKRSLPWRETTNPYFIWVSEIILQQTRVAQGLPYYIRFIEKFPDINALASASLESLLKLWQGLGYYSRARNMHYAAKQIVQDYNGIFPTSYKELLKLKGIGEYTAAAIASIAYNEPVAVVDGNVIRVISRLFAVQESVGKPSVMKEIKQLTGDVLLTNKPALFNQAIMEFGALYCIPVKPDCANCPLNDKCLAYKYNVVEKLPVKKEKIKVRERFFCYMVICTNNGVLFRKRASGDIWEGLFEFPLIETRESIQPESISELIQKQSIFKGEFQITGFSKPVKHILTHQRLNVSFVHIKVKDSISINLSDIICKGVERIHELAVPRVIDRYLNSDQFNKMLHICK